LYFVVVCAEKGDARTKIDTLKKLIQMILNGEKTSPSVLMTVIRFVMPMQDHMVKKLLLVFWEVVPKYHPDGKLMQEMILVCDAYRKVRVYTLMIFVKWH
jgi:coatomer subunit beta